MADRTVEATPDEEAFLTGLINSGVKLGLETSRALCERAGRPDLGYPIVHVAGTNGKGSVCAMLAGALRHAGIRAGFFSSPHLVSVRERIRVDCRALSKSEFGAVIRELREAGADLLAREDGTSPTYFEFLAIAALVAFRRTEVDVAILEVGMGGRLDSTNVVTPEVSVITHIGLDHVGPLGDTHAAIAGEKAGIIKEGVPVVCGVRDPDALAVIEAIAAERRAPLYCIGREFDVTGYVARGEGSEVSGRCGDRSWTVPTSLAGRHQADNAAVVMMVLALLADRFGARVLSGEGMDTVVWPARCQRLRNGMILDAAHNPSSIESLVQTLSDRYPGKRWPILFGAAKDKDLKEILGLLEPIVESLHAVTIPNPRAASADDIANVAATALSGTEVHCYDSVGAALTALARTSHQFSSRETQTARMERLATEHETGVLTAEGRARALRAQGGEAGKHSVLGAGSVTHPFAGGCVSQQETGEKCGLDGKSALIAGSLYLAGAVMETLYGPDPVEMV